MSARFTWVLIWLLAASCAIAGVDEPRTPAMVLWLRGQDAMRVGNIDTAIGLYEQSLQLEPKLARNHLSLAAGHIALGQDSKAARHLERYLELEPEHHVVRGHFAELLLRLGKAQQARVEFERFIADIQENEELARQHLIACHSRLMEIAEGAEDSYGEHLHRGIGLYLLAQQRARLGDERSPLTAEGLLCQAAGELSLARRERPDEARPCWYLHEVWSRLAQTQPASRWLQAAEAAAPFSYLTPQEQAGLQLACRRLACAGNPK